MQVGRVAGRVPAMHLGGRLLPDFIVNLINPYVEVGKSMIDFDWGGDEEKRTHDVPFCHPGTRVTPHNTILATSSSPAARDVGFAGGLPGPVS